MNTQSNMASDALSLLPPHIETRFTQDDSFTKNRAPQQDDKHTEDDLLSDDKQYNKNAFMDGKLSLTVGHSHYDFQVAIKTIHRKESLQPLLDNVAPNTLLICNRLTPYLADVCTRNKLNFIDTAGNIKIHYEGLYLWVEPRINKIQKLLTDEVKPRKFGEGSAKLLFTLLSQPDILNYSYREIAEHANISLGMVNKGLNLLADESLINLGKPRKILDAKRMLGIWLEVYSQTIRPKLKSVRLNYQGNWQDLATEDNGYYGGEVSEEIRNRYPNPHRLQLFTRLPFDEAQAQLNGRQNPEGNLWLAARFWGDKLEWTHKSQSLLAIAELEANKQEMSETFGLDKI